MDRRQLECFVAVVDGGGFHAAAARLFVTQSAVSQALRGLEAELGETLLRRRRGGLALTAAGEMLLPIARDILRRFEEGRQSVAALRGLLRGRLTIGAVDVAALYHLPAPLRAFKREHESLEIAVRVAGSRALAAALRQGELDLAIVIAHPLPPGLEARPFRRDPMEVVAPPDLLAHLGARPSPAAIAALGWISYPRGSVTRELLDAAFAAASLPFPVRMEIDRPEAIYQLARAGLGLAVLPQGLLESLRPGAALRRLHLRGLRCVRSIEIVHRPGPELSPAARAFLDRLR